MALSKFEKDLLKVSVLQAIEALTAVKASVSEVVAKNIDDAVAARRNLLKKMEDENII